MKYFCACERICMMDLVGMSCPICFQSLSYSFSASRNWLCSSFVQDSRGLVMVYGLRDFLVLDWLESGEMDAEAVTCLGRRGGGGGSGWD